MIVKLRALAPLVLLLACSPEAREAPSANGAGTFAGFGSFFAAAESAPSDQAQLVYLSTYSNLTLFGTRKWELSTNVSIRNIDPEDPVYVENVAYYDSSGNLVETYLDAMHRLEPMATTTLTVPQQDQRGGAGANFLIRWRAGAGVNPPLIEAVMAGVSGNQSFSFLTKGVAIAE